MAGVDACWSCRSGPPSSTGRTCRLAPTPTSRSRSAARLAAPGRRGGRAGAALRVLGRARRVRRHAVDRRGRPGAGRRRAGAQRRRLRRRGARVGPRRQRRAARRRGARRCGPRGAGCWRWSPRVEGGDAHAGRTETSLLLALAPGIGAATLGRGGRHPAARRAAARAASGRRGLGVAPTACSATRPARRRPRGRRCSTPWRPTSPRRAVAAGGARDRAQGRGRHGRRPRHRRGHRAGAGRRRVAPGARRPLRRRPRPRLRARHAARSSTPSSPPAAGRPWPSAWSATCATRPPSTAPSPSPSSGSAASTPPSPPPGASPAALLPGPTTRPCGRRCSASTSRVSGASPGPRCRRCSDGRRRGTAASWPSRRPAAPSGSRCSPPTPPPSTACTASCAAWPPSSGPQGITANAVAPGSTTTAMLDASAAVYDLPDIDEFAEHHLLGRLLEPDGGRRPGRLAVRPDERSGVTGAVAAGRRRHDRRLIDVAAWRLRARPVDAPHRRRPHAGRRHAAADPAALRRPGPAWLDRVAAGETCPTARRPRPWPAAWSTAASPSPCRRRCRTVARPTWPSSSP